MKKAVGLAGVFLSAILLTALSIVQETFIGDLIEVDDQYIVVERENEDGSFDNLTFVIDEETKFFDDDEVCTVDDLEEFDLVKVDYRQTEEQYIATVVTILPDEEDSEEPAR